MCKADSFSAIKQHDSAFFYFLIAEKELEIKPNKLELAKLYQQMALWYNKRKMPNKAIEKINKAIDIVIHDDSLKLAHYYFSKSNIYLSQKQMDSSRVYVELAQKLNYQNKDTLLDMLIQTNLYYYALYQRDTLRQISYLERAYKLSFYNAKTRLHQTWVGLALAKLYKRQRQYGRAISLLKQSIELTDNNHLKLLAALHDELSYCYRKIDMPDSAYYHSRKQVWYLKVQFSKNITEKSLELEAKYENGIAKEKLAKFELEQEYSIKKQKLLYTIIGISLLLIAALFLAVRSYRKSLISSKKIAQQNLIESEQKAKIKAMDSMVRGQEMERGRLARELHDGVAGSMLLVKMALENKNQNQQLNESIKYISNSISLVRDLSKTIIPLSLEKFGLAMAVEDLVLRLKNNNSTIINLSIKGIEAKESLNPEIELHAYRCIEEASLNSIKHANASEIFISINKLDSVLNITIEDDGIGFDKTIKSKGIGLKNIKSRAQIMKAFYQLETIENKGTTLIIKIPIPENH